ncbi:MAG: ATP-binding cassette domain-containing protein [Pseudomonadota bacterium]
MLNKCAAEIPTPSMTLITGRNGSGKSTLLDILSGFKQPRLGQVRINNVELYSSERSVRELRTLVSYMPASLRLPAHLTVSYIFDLWGGSYFSNEILNALNLTDFMRHRYSQLSDGYKHRVNLAVCISRGGMVFLDEPLRSQDDELKKFFPEFISKYMKNRTLIATSPDVIDGVKWDKVYTLENGELK